MNPTDRRISTLIVALVREEIERIEEAHWYDTQEAVERATGDY
jgi:hypothetical protein